MLKYEQFLLETFLSEEKAGLHLELNDAGKNKEPFEYYYSPQMDDNNYFVMKSIPFDEYEPEGNRVTYLYNTIFKDTHVQGRKKLNNTNFDEDQYYFFKLVSTPRRHDDNEVHGVSIAYNGNEDRFNEFQLTQDGRKHYIVIEKNKYSSLVRLNSGQRHATGDRAEKLIANAFGWRLDKTKINIPIVKRNVANHIIPDAERKAVLSDILKGNNGDDLFDLEPPEPINKYDLVITHGNFEGKKIEVKRYSAEDIFYKTGIPKKILMAEQLKIATKPGLKKLVDIYKEMHPEANVQPLLENYRNDRGLQLSNYFSKDGGGDHEVLIDNIRRFYNARINYMFGKYANIPKNLLMDGIYGIYFFNDDNGVDGFFIRTENPEGGRNLRYSWEVEVSHWGLNRIKMMVEVNPKSYRLVWVGDLYTFVETYEVDQVSKIPSKEDSIIRGTDVGTIAWDRTKKYWDIVPDDIKGGVGGIFLNRKNKKSNSIYN